MALVRSEIVQKPLERVDVDVRNEIRSLIFGQSLDLRISVFCHLSDLVDLGSADCASVPPTARGSSGSAASGSVDQRPFNNGKANN
jgi:hypothetical protein